MGRLYQQQRLQTIIIQSQTRECHNKFNDLHTLTILNAVSLNRIRGHSHHF